MKLTQGQLHSRIAKRISKLADDAFDPEEVLDSDGNDQAERDGLLQALAIVDEEFNRNTVVQP